MHHSFCSFSFVNLLGCSPAVMHVVLLPPGLLPRLCPKAEPMHEAFRLIGHRSTQLANGSPAFLQYLHTCKTNTARQGSFVSEKAAPGSFTYHGSAETQTRLVPSAHLQLGPPSCVKLPLPAKQYIFLPIKWSIVVFVIFLSFSIEKSLHDTVPYQPDDHTTALYHAFEQSRHVKQSRSTDRALPKYPQWEPHHSIEQRCKVVFRGCTSSIRTALVHRVHRRQQAWD